MAKPTKRIQSVTVKKLYDENPDTSWLGEYSDTPKSEYTIDRANDEFTGDQETGRDWLERIETRLQEELDSVNAGEDESKNYTDIDEFEHQQAVYAIVLEEALATVDGLRDKIGDDYWDSRDYRYFNGPVENYEGDTPENIRKYVRQDYERMEGVNNGDWCFMGVRAEAEVIVDFKHAPSYHGLTQTVTSGGLWGNESDMPKCDWQEVYSEQLAELKDQLLALGFSRRAIATAYKSVEYKDGE